jgi:hypothetical protein
MMRRLPPELRDGERDINALSFALAVDGENHSSSMMPTAFATSSRSSKRANRNS